MPAIAKSYVSPTLVLLAYDWAPGSGRNDFLGFAIQRTPGFDGAVSSWLPNRIGFNGPKPDQSDFPSNEAPIQKFYWWDARITTLDRGTSFSYKIVPVAGTAAAVTLLDAESTTLQVSVPHVEENGITSHFNRAVVSSQAFSKEFPELKTAVELKAARAWLGNGMEQAVPEFVAVAGGKDIDGAIYHLTDQTWILPSLLNYAGQVSLAYNQTANDHASDDAIQQLVSGGRPATSFVARTHANIMHNKFLVRVGHAGQPEAVLAGSANFTSEGLSAQANVLHAFESPDLADLYLSRMHFLSGNPAMADTRKAQSGWSDQIQVGDAKIRVFFPPESATERASLDAIVDAIKGAQHSVLFCAFDPTDEAMLNALFQKADEGKMMLALVNRVAKKAPGGDPTHADVKAAIAIMDRAQADHDIVGFDAFSTSHTPTDFLPERVLWPGEDPKIMVRVHHKFAVIDAEGENPIVFTGSANFSGNSLHNNDENLLQITECPRLAGMYMAEFLRLFEHYRARAAYDRRAAGDNAAFTLTADSSWSVKYYKNGTPECKAREAMAGV